MAGNSFGKRLIITTYGESHGTGIGVVIDGCPPNIDIDIEKIQHELDRRKPGQSKITTQRKEEDRPIIQSGVFEGKSTGMPISIHIKNKDHKSKDYDHISEAYRPSHADMVYDKKYGIRDYRGGGRSSARETATRVAAGAVAKMILFKSGIKVNAAVTRVGHIKLDTNIKDIEWEASENNIVRCPDSKIAKEMESYIAQVKNDGDTVGGVISCYITNVPVGLGEPVFDKLQADLAKAMLSINAVKGFEYGSGFNSVSMKGSEHNDAWDNVEGHLITKTNNSGGIQGGISNGMPIYFNVAFKPVSTIMKDQKSVNADGQNVNITGRGRHDPCVVPRAVAIVEAMAALVIADHLLRLKSLTT